MKLLLASQHPTANGMVPDGFADGGDWEIEIESESARIAGRLAGPAAPRVVLLDFDAPEIGGIAGIQALRPALTDRPLGVLLADASADAVRAAMFAGASAVIPGGLSATAFGAALTLLACGHGFALLGRDLARDRLTAAAALSEREVQVLHGICSGLQNKEIAHEFQVQEVTVKMHVRAIIRKLGARNRTHAAMIARDLGIV